MLTYDFMQNAFAAALAVAVVSGLTGFFLVLRAQTFAGHALSHVGFAGATGAALIGVAPLWGLIAMTLAGGIAMGLLGERHVLDGAEVAQHRRDLERAREAQLHAPMHRQPGDVATEEADGARIGRQAAGELADQGRLAGAVGADQGMDLAGAHLDRKVVGRDQAAEALDQDSR